MIHREETRSRRILRSVGEGLVVRLRPAARRCRPYAPVPGWRSHARSRPAGRVRCQRCRFASRHCPAGAGAGAGELLLADNPARLHRCPSRSRARRRPPSRTTTRRPRLHPGPRVNAAAAGRFQPTPRRARPPRAILVPVPQLRLDLSRLRSEPARRHRPRRGPPSPHCEDLRRSARACGYGRLRSNRDRLTPRSARRRTSRERCLAALGLPNTGANVQALDAWQEAEGGFVHMNPLNTTQAAPGSTTWNSVGVKTYPDWKTAIRATAQTLKNGQYRGVMAALKKGNDVQAMAHAPRPLPRGVRATSRGSSDRSTPRRRTGPMSRPSMAW